MNKTVLLAGRHRLVAFPFEPGIQCVRIELPPGGIEEIAGDLAQDPEVSISRAPDREAFIIECRGFRAGLARTNEGGRGLATMMVTQGA